MKNIDFSRSDASYAGENGMEGSLGKCFSKLTGNKSGSEENTNNFNMLKEPPDQERPESPDHYLVKMKKAAGAALNLFFARSRA
ncbi:hypothetical protein WNZ15_10680 [Roseibium sp. AS2]|uniref:hypothetical protein n=1 Tax=Roseibium sp. AS2 TaxID=3135781 RepID=UPI00316EA7F4